MRTALASIFLFGALSVSAESPVPQRFTGSAHLQAAPPASADGRFGLSADLRPMAQTAATGRFNINAAIRPGGDAKALATACGPVTSNIFTNGFEN